MNSILYRQETSAKTPRPKMTFEKNETVKIIDGPFANFSGKIDEINARAQYAAGAGDDFWPRHSSGTGFPTSREDVGHKHGKES